MDVLLHSIYDIISCGARFRGGPGTPKISAAPSEPALGLTGTSGLNLLSSLLVYCKLWRRAYVACVHGEPAALCTLRAPATIVMCCCRGRMFPSLLLCSLRAWFVGGLLHHVLALLFKALWIWDSGAQHECGLLFVLMLPGSVQRLCWRAIASHPRALHCDLPCASLPRCHHRGIVYVRQCRPSARSTKPAQRSGCVRWLRASSSWPCLRCWQGSWTGWWPWTSCRTPSPMTSLSPPRAPSAGCVRAGLALAGTRSARAAV
eukprot:1157425-Pelagomonas_calceolata.AAC.4